MGRVAIVDPLFTGQQIARELRDRGWSSVAVFSGARALERFREAGDTEGLTEILGEGGLAATLAGLAGTRVDAVVAGSERGVELTDALAGALGLPGNGTALSASRRDKVLMAGTLAAAGIRVPRTAAFAAADDVVRWADEHRVWPVVVKPRRSAGSDSVHFCQTPAEVRAAVGAIVGRVSRLDERNDSVCAQEPLVGRQHFLNTVSVDGRHSVVEIWRDRKRSLPGRRLVYDTEELLPRHGPAQSAVVDYTRTVLDALGIRFGPAHTEVVLTADGPVLVEVGARVQGQIPLVAVRLALGHHHVSRTVDAIVDPDRFAAAWDEPYRLRTGLGTVCLIAPFDGTLRDASPLSAGALPTLAEVVGDVRTGAPVRQTVDFFTTPGVLVLAGSREEIARDTARVREMEAAGLYAACPAAAVAEPAAVPETVLLIGSGAREFREYVLDRVAARYRLVLLDDAAPTWQKPYLADHAVAALDDPDEMVGAARRLAARHRVAGVFTYDEACVEAAAQVAADLGLPHAPGAAVRRCRDKLLMRHALHAAGVPSPRFAPAGALAEAFAATQGWDFPVVVKPRALASSAGVVRADAVADLPVAFTAAREARIAGLPAQSGVLVEEYLDGPEISVDAVVSGGTAYPAVVARKRLGFAPYFEETGHVVSALDPPPGLAAVRELITSAVAALGFDRGVAHVEVRLTAAGPRIVEVNPRLGGDLIPYLGFLATGVDLATAAARVATGGTPDLTPRWHRAAAVEFFHTADDLVVGSTGLALNHRPAWLERVVWLVEPGEAVRPGPGRAWCRLGFAVVTGRDTRECDDRLAEVRAAVRINGRRP